MKKKKDRPCACGGTDDGAACWLRLQRQTIRLRGPASAAYQVFGDYAAPAGPERRSEVEVRETAGSAASLRLLSGKRVPADARWYRDMAQDAYNQTGAFAESEVEINFSTVAVLYQEECHIVVRADSGINTVGGAAKARPSALARKNPARSRTPKQISPAGLWPGRKAGQGGQP